MGKTRDIFKKIRNTKGIFHAKMGSIKDRNGMGLTEAEDIKKRWREYTEELYKKDHHDPDNHYGVITDEDFLTSPCHSLELLSPFLFLPSIFPSIRILYIQMALK